MGLPKGQLISREFVYDFAVNGGAVGAITLSASDYAGSTFESGFVITGLDVEILTIFAGAATPTVTLGNTGDNDGFLVDFYASTAAVGVLRSGNVAGALLWDDTNDDELNYRVNATANNQNVIMTVGVHALTAGRARFIFKGYKQKA